MKLPYFAFRDHVQTGGLRGSDELYSLLYVAFAWGVSALLVVGGIERWQGEAFAIARLIPWSPYSWAAWLFVAALVMGIGAALPDEQNDDKLSTRGWAIVVGAMGCAVWCFSYGWCLYRAGQVYPTQVGPLGPFVWGCIGFWYMIRVGQHLEFKTYAVRRESPDQ